VHTRCLNCTNILVDISFLTTMKKNSMLVNIALGDLMVEEDLKLALDMGSPAQAILDVFNQEPLAEDVWFWHHPNVNLTPHCSNGGSGMRKRSDDFFIENLYRISNGQLLLNKVNAEDIL
jgi:phosphoglycerate dehydrogenase-like enzyme